MWKIKRHEKFIGDLSEQPGKLYMNGTVIQPCTQSSGTAVHHNLFFLPVFVSFWRQIFYWLLRILTMFSSVFLLAACDPSPYCFWQSGRKNPQLIPTTSTSWPRPWRDGRTNTSVYSLQATWSRRRIWEVTHYPTINSIGLLVRMLSIFPWLVRVVSDRSVL